MPVEFNSTSSRMFPLIEMDEYCRDGTLLTLATPDDLQAYWTWYLGEFVR